MPAQTSITTEETTSYHPIDCNIRESCKSTGVVFCLRKLPNTHKNPPNYLGCAEHSDQMRTKIKLKELGRRLTK